MNTHRPPTQAPAPLPETLARAIVTAEAWQTCYTAEHRRAERLHETLRRIAATAGNASDADVPADTALALIRELAEEAITR